MSLYQEAYKTAMNPKDILDAWNLLVRVYRASKEAKPGGATASWSL